MGKGSTSDLRSSAGLILGDRYRLEQYLASGTFGAVYRATQLAYGTTLREVAIKIANRPMQPSEARHAFHDALTMARVVDEAGRVEMARRFVAVFDAGICPEGGPLAGHPYMVMELVRGTTLADCIRQGPFPLQRALTVFESLLECVAFMHTPGSGGRGEGVVIHRDIKPENILVSPNESGGMLIKLTDFGLAVDLATVLSSSESGGTLAYLAPESFSEGTNSTGSDVYSLALVFYEMVSGRNPFGQVGTHLGGDADEKSEELARLHQSARTMETFPVLETSPELRARPEIGQVVRAALTENRRSRPYRDAAEFLAAFRSAMAGNVHLRDESPVERALRLTSQAEREAKAGNQETADKILKEVMGLHAEPDQIPDHLLVGRAYHLWVERLLAMDQFEEAGRIAQEGFRRRRCRSTHLAMAAFCRRQNAGLAQNFERLAKELPPDHRP